jgi:Domain of unknown function (DUF4843)
MFKLKYLSVIALGLILIFACKKQKLLTYNTANTIYFADSNGIQFIDTGFFSFAFSDSTVMDSSFGINVYVTGGPSSQDRVFSVVADGASTAIAGQEYVLPDSCVFHAGHVKDTLYVKLLRAKLLQDSTVHLVLDLKSNLNFQANLPFLYDDLEDTLSATSYQLGINDILTSGPYWTGIIQPYFGNFSVKKVQLMNQVVALPLNFWTSNVLTDLDLGPQSIYYAIAFTKYLNAQAAASDTVYDTGGLPMTMGVGY